MAQHQIASDRVPACDAIQRWVDDRLAEAPPITPEQAATLSHLMADARNEMSDAAPTSLSRAL